MSQEAYIHDEYRLHTQWSVSAACLCYIFSSKRIWVIAFSFCRLISVGKTAGNKKVAFRNMAPLQDASNTCHTYTVAEAKSKMLFYIINSKYPFNCVNVLHIAYWFGYKTWHVVVNTKVM